MTSAKDPNISIQKSIYNEIPTELVHEAIDFNHLKALLTHIRQLYPRDCSFRSTCSHHLCEEFQTTLLFEINKTNDFCCKRFDALTRKRKNTRDKQDEANDSDVFLEPLLDTVMLTIPSGSVRDPRVSFRYYHLLLQLRSFQSVNYLMILQLIQSHDSYHTEHLQMALKVTNLPLYTNIQVLTQEIQKFEQDYATTHFNGDLSLAQVDLHLHHIRFLRRTRSTDWSTYLFGVQMGMIVIFLSWVLWDCFMDESRNHNIWHSPVLAVYRGIGVVVLLFWCWGFNLWIWTRCRINYVQIFGMPSSISCVKVWKQASSFTILYLLNFLLYYKALRGNYKSSISAHYYPLFLYLYVILQVVWSCSRRPKFVRACFSVIAAPFAVAGFAESYIGDVLTSLIRVNVDLAWSSCYFISGEFNEVRPAFKDHCSQSPFYQNAVIPLLHALPLWWRFCQNLRRYHETHRRFPHLPNALKYALAQSVVLFGIFHPSFKHMTRGTHIYQSMWLLTFVVATIYQFIWDVKMDWGLADWHSGFLRKILLFRTRRVYFLAIGLDLILRFLWTLSIIPENKKLPFGSIDMQLYLSPVLAAAEVLRRCMWGCFRLENEHITSNVSKHASSRSPGLVDSSLLHEEESDGDDDLNESNIMILMELALFAFVVILVAIIAVVSGSG